MNNQNRNFLYWLGFHGAILFGFILYLTLFNGFIRFDTNLLSVIPNMAKNPDFNYAVRTFFNSTNNTINLFIESNTFEKAVEHTEDFIRFFQDPKFAKDTTILSNTTEIDSIFPFLNTYKYHLLPEKTKKLLQENNEEKIAQNALETAFSPFYMPLVAELSTDPFLLGNTKLFEIVDTLSLLSNMKNKQGHLYVEYENKYNIFLNIELLPTYSDKFIHSFLDYIDTFNKSENNGHIYFSSPAIHAYFAQASAEKEITLISLLSMFGIILLFYLMFRSVVPLVFGISTILLSFFVAFTGTLFIFSEIHIFTLVFGTSLIGITIDYTVHYMTETYYSNNHKDVLSLIFPSLIMGFATTMLSFTALLFTDMALLQQMAVFSLFGMASSFLTVTLSFPYLFSKYITKQNTSSQPYLKGYQKQFIQYINLILNKYNSYRYFIKNPFLILCFILFVIFGISKINFDFSTASLYTLSDTLLENEIAMNMRLGEPATQELIIVQGESLDHALEIEESIRQYIENPIQVSRFLPSQKTQRENLELVENKLFPLLDSHLEKLNVSDAKESIVSEYVNTKNTYLTHDIIHTLPSANMLQKLILEHNNQVFLFTLQDIDSKTQEQINETENVFALSFISDMDTALKNIAKEALVYIFAAYSIVFIFILFSFNKVQALIVMAIQFISVAMNMSIHGYLGLSINIFSIFALILALGISIDYTLFFAKSKAEPAITGLAVCIAMITTLFSFATLSFSTFIPVQSFALSLFFGIIFSFICAPLAGQTSSE